MENFIIYGIGGIISKLIPLIMVPIVTRLMPTTDYYGISDLSNTVVQFGSALAIMGMYDAMYRLFFEKDEKEYKRAICSTTLSFTIATSIVVFFIMLIFKDIIAQFFFSSKDYAYVVYLSAMATLVEATNSIVSAPTRMQNKRRVFLVTNTISPILSYGISIPLLLSGHYIIALPLAMALSGFAIEVSFGIMNREWFSIKLFDYKYLKQLLLIAIPLLPNFLIYWIFNSCDKVMITNMIGVGAAGVYSVGSKFGQASQLIYLAFAGGWQYYAFSTMREDNQVESNSKVFEYLAAISFIATMLMSSICYLIFKLLFTQDYLEGYIVVPYLFMAPLLQMLFQVAASQFLVIKKTWPNIFILSAGALINIIINLYFIPILGIEGAALATLLGYVVSDTICIIVLKRMKLIVISKEFIISTLLISVFLISWRLLYSKNVLLGILITVGVSTIICILYKEPLKILLKSVKKSEF